MSQRINAVGASMPCSLPATELIQQGTYTLNTLKHTRLFDLPLAFYLFDNELGVATNIELHTSRLLSPANNCFQRSNQRIVLSLVVGVAVTEVEPFWLLCFAANR